jgi:hypothetical protein
VVVTSGSVVHLCGSLFFGGCYHDKIIMVPGLNELLWSLLNRNWRGGSSDKRDTICYQKKITRVSIDYRGDF